jgi:hypothetical protein
MTRWKTGETSFQMKLSRSRNRRDEGVIVTEISSYSITGFVARIVTDDDLIINKGRADGVVEGMIFDILDTRTRDIKDPYTGEDLGSFNRVKAKVRVDEVGDRISLARITPSRGGAISEAARIVAGVPKTSRYTSEVWPEGVEVGDPVGFAGIPKGTRPQISGPQSEGEA